MARSQIRGGQIEPLDLTTEVTGTLPVANGGTGAATVTGLVKGNGTSPMSAATAGTDYVSPSSTEELSHKTLVDPKIYFDVYDANSNKILGLASTASAVNYVLVGNQTSGNAPIIQAYGPGADVDLSLIPKGAGRVFANGSAVVSETTTQDMTGKRATLAAGSTSVAPLKFTSGTNLTTPAAGALEFDGSTFAGTIDTTSGRALSPMDQMFRLSADGSAIGATIADYFGTNSAFPYVASAVYEIVWYLLYTKNTSAGTVTYTITSTTTPTLLSAWYTQTVIGGVGTVGAAQQAAVVKSTSATAALPATGSLTLGVNHQAEIHCIYQAGTTGNLRLRCTESASTITPLAGSFYRVRRLPSGNVGTFVA